MKRYKDVLLVARPDQSVDIYNALRRDGRLAYLYITFKLFPKWLSRIIRNKKLRYISGSYKISYMTTLVNTLKYNLRLKCFANSNENFWIERLVAKTTKHNQFKVMHYWPKYCHGDIIKKIKSTGTFTIADIHMPNPNYVIDMMKGVYEKYGITADNTFLAKYSEEIKEHLANEDNVMVPSSYVVETMKMTFPDKNYFVVPYGITVSSQYKRKSDITDASMVKNFVYAGKISLEKGCDVLLEWFLQNSKYNIHLYGEIAHNQVRIFEKYKNVSNIIFHGVCPKSILQQELLRYDAGIHLSRFDAYSLAVGEIIGSGLPVIVSDATGIKDDVLKHGFGLVTSLDMNEISEKIRLFVMPESYNRFIKNIDDYINSRNETFGEQTVSFYKSVIEKNDKC